MPGIVRLETVGDKTVLRIETEGAKGQLRRYYILTKLDPDPRVAFPAFCLENEEGSLYHVCHDEHGWRCDCPAHTFDRSGRNCKHAKAIAALWGCGRLEGL